MHSAPVKYLIVIDSGGPMVARLFNAERAPVMDMDASTEEVVATIDGLMPTASAADPEWDRALAGHSGIERAMAEVYTLAV
ncbi:hypothetical protein [Rhodoferax ferrireducens]|uniref:hypothetical protein n=1 Tax=Rhodoferax ferrireducens TaxID=192843 RepID=UPI000E0DC219|nr:hypothetical protein [Rhodoferax ferrireducens]